MISFDDFRFSPGIIVQAAQRENITGFIKLKLKLFCLSFCQFSGHHIQSTFVFFIMAVQQSLLFLIFTAISVSVDSFAVRCPSASFLAIASPVPPMVATTTCLFAEEENETEAPGDETVESGEAAPAPNAETDILSSPAFLKRKLEVLKSDIEATIKETEEAQALAEAGKAEWGSQLDALRLEVSNLLYIAKSYSSVKLLASLATHTCCVSPSKILMIITV
jgi:hypothetical protein